MAARWIVPAVLLGVSATPLRGQADGEELFRSHCVACHSTGADRVVGPGLADVVERRDRAWLVAQITEPDRLIAAGDSIAERLVTEYEMAMPNLGITPGQAESILDYLARAEAPGGDGPAVADLPTEEEIALGRALFEGTTRLANRGPSCNTCHDVTHDLVLGGGSLARNLTASHSRLGGPRTRSILENLPFPVMQRAYAGRPLTDEEIVGLTAFLQRVDARRADHEPRRYGTLLLGAGFLGAGLLLGACSVAWRKRRKGSVNQDIFDRQIDSR